MIRKYLWRLLIVLALMEASACSSATNSVEEETAKANAKEEANRFWDAFSQPTIETRAQWAMNDFRVFGRDDFIGYIAAGQTSVEKLAGAESAYEVVIPFWCEGEDNQGRPVKFSRKLAAQVIRLGNEGGWRMRGHQFREDAPLTFGQQVMSWLFWSFIGPMIIWLWVFLLGGFSSETMGCATLVTRLLTLPLVAYAGYVCFGSGAIVLVCLIVYFILASVGSSILQAMAR